MLACAILGDTVLVCEPIKRYIDMRPKAVRNPKLSKNGVPLGRKPTKPLKEKGFDHLAYALFMEDVGEALRKKCKIRPGQKVMTCTDGAGFHHKTPVKIICDKYSIEYIAHYPSRSPGCNAIENMFGTVQGRLDEMYVEEHPPKDADDSINRFKKLCDDLGKEGILVKTARSFKQRMKRIIDNKGGPTKD